MHWIIYLLLEEICIDKINIEHVFLLHDKGNFKTNSLTVAQLVQKLLQLFK